MKIFKNLLSFLSINKFIVIGGFLLISVLSSGYFYIKSLKSTIDKLNNDIVSIQKEYENQRIIIDNIKRDVVKAQEIQREIQAVQLEKERALKELNDTFIIKKEDGTKQSFKEIILESVKEEDIILYQNMINVGPLNVLKCIENLSKFEDCNEFYK